MTIKPEILDFAKQYDLARSWLNLLSAQVEVSQAERRLQELKSEISTLDRLNVFTDTREEAEEKDCKQRVQSRQKDVVRHAKDVAGALKELCAQDPEFGLALELEGHLLSELTTRIASITAVVHSRTVEDSEGNTSTEYYSVAQGKTEAVETSLTIRRLLEKSSSKYPFPQQWLEEYTENQTSREIVAQPLVL